MSNNNKGKISIANIIAMLGLAGIGVVTFFGMFLHSKDGTPGIAIIGAVGLIAGLTLLLILSIKAKGAEDNPDKWRFVEWGAVAAFVIVAVLFAAPFQRFFYVVAEKETVQDIARKEIKTIKDMYSNYERQCNKFLTEASEQVVNYRLSKQYYGVDKELASYVDSIVGSNVESWETKARAIVKLPKDETLAQIESDVESWNLMVIPVRAAELEDRETTAWTDVEKKIRQFGENNKLIPVIGGGGLTHYSFDGYAHFDLGEKPEAEFARQIRSVNGNTVIGWIVYAFLNLSVLLNYLVANRSRFVGPRSNSKTGGMPL